jgi:hypothetical protein
MKYLALALVVTLSALTFAGCKKTAKAEPAKPQPDKEQMAERVSGPMAVDIVWEEIDLK